MRRIALITIGLVLAQTASAINDSISASDVYGLLNRIATHARIYPPTFASPDERHQTEEELRQLLALADELSTRYPNDTDVLFIKGEANAMGHNMDFLGCADKAIYSFERLLIIAPFNKQVMFEYGTFLSSTKLLDKSAAILVRALALGEEKAHYALGVVYLKMGDIKKALTEFEAYLQVDPGNTAVKKLIANIKDGRASAIVSGHGSN